MRTKCNLEVDPVTRLKSESQRNFDLIGIEYEMKFYRNLMYIGKK